MDADVFKELYGAGFSRRLPSGRWQALFPDGKGKHKPLGTYATEQEADGARLAAAKLGETPALIGTKPFGEYGLEAIERIWADVRRHGRDLDRIEQRNAQSRWKWVEECMPAALQAVECLDKSDCEQFMLDLLEEESEREELVSNSTIYQIWILLRKVCKQAVKDRLIETSPMDGVECSEREGDPRKQPNPLMRRELDQMLICPTYTAKQRAALSLVPFTGLRKGELASLWWTDIHNLFDGRGACSCNLAGRERGPHLHVNKSWKRKCTKNGHDRIVWLIEPAVTVLRAWHEHPDRIRSSKLVWGIQHARGYDFGWAPKTDKHHGICYLGARREAGITRRVTFHHLRDTYASHLISGTFGRRWSIEEVAKQLGHSATYVTERYATLVDDALEVAASQTRGFAVPAAGDVALRSPQAAKQTLHETLHGARGGQGHATPEAFDIIQHAYQHAQRDSNPRLSDPKSKSVSTFSTTSSGRAVSVQCSADDLASMANQLLADYAAARHGMSPAEAAELEAAALRLAAAVLGSEVVTLASRVADNDRLMFTHAIELARLLTQRPAEAAAAPIHRTHNGQSGRLIGR